MLYEYLINLVCFRLLVLGSFTSYVSCGVSSSTPNLRVIFLGMSSFLSLLYEIDRLHICDQVRQWCLISSGIVFCVQLVWNPGIICYLKCSLSNANLEGYVVVRSVLL